MIKEFTNEQEYRQYLREKIKGTGNVQKFARDNGIERASIYGFLIGRSASPTEEKILSALGLKKEEKSIKKITIEKI